MNRIDGFVPNHSCLNVSSLALSSLQKKVQVIWEACQVLWLLFKQWISVSPYEIRELDLNTLSVDMQKQLKEFEREFSYPLGEQKRFRIVHGKGEGDYFGFFKAMGTPKFYVAIHRKERRIVKRVQVQGQWQSKEVVLKAGEIAGVGCAVLRNIPLPNGKSFKAWYLCDFKTKEAYRGEHILLRLFQKGFWRFFQCSKGYAICMNPADGSVPKAAQIWQKHGVLSSGSVPLNLYQFKAEDLTAARPALEEACQGKIAFKSMSGLKDFNIFSENAPEETTPWKLLHIQHQEAAQGPSVLPDPLPEHDHLIAAIEGSALDQSLAKVPNIQKFSSATLLYRGFDPQLLERRIFTNEI